MIKQAKQTNDKGKKTRKKDDSKIEVNVPCSTSHKKAIERFITQSSLEINHHLSCELLHTLTTLKAGSNKGISEQIEATEALDDNLRIKLDGEVLEALTQASHGLNCDYLNLAAFLLSKFSESLPRAKEGKKLKIPCSLENEKYFRHFSELTGTRFDLLVISELLNQLACFSDTSAFHTARELQSWKEKHHFIEIEVPPIVWNVFSEACSCLGVEMNRLLGALFEIAASMLNEGMDDLQKEITVWKAGKAHHLPTKLSDHIEHRVRDAAYLGVMMRAGTKHLHFLGVPGIISYHRCMSAAGS